MKNTNERRLRGVMGIIEKDGKYLFGRESKDSPIKGLWRLVGGKLEGSENFAQAMIREAREETCIEVQVDGLLGSTNGQYRDIIIDICYGRHVSGELKPKLDEFSEVGWFSFDDTLIMDIETTSRCMFYMYIAKFKQA